MTNRAKGLGIVGLALGGFLAATPHAGASSHREALAILNEPCADNTDVYAWVKPGTHDKLYLIGNFLPLHEPGQGNQGLRACNNYRYEFHVAKGTKLKDEVIYRVEFNTTKPTDDPPSATDGVGGGNELLFQISGSQETYNVTRIAKKAATLTGHSNKLGSNIPVAPNDHGPQTDRLVYGLGPFEGYDGDPDSRTTDLYSDAFAATFVKPLSNGGRAFAGQRDDPFYLDEKGIFDLVNLCQDGLFGIPGARSTPCEDVFAGFNLFTIALEIPIGEFFAGGVVPHNGTPGNDTLLRVWFTISRPEKSVVDDKDPIDGLKHEGPYRQVGREALPLFNAGLVGMQRHTLYLRSEPSDDVHNFAGDILNPVLVRDAEALGIYAALGIDPNAAGLKHDRFDIIAAINLDNYPTPGAHSIPVAPGFTGDVITMDAALDPQFPNGRSIPGGPVGMNPLGCAPGTSNREQADVSDVLISLIVAGNPAAGAGDGVNGNDKCYLAEFPFVAAPHSGLNGGHGAPSP